ncbi:MAG TPA: hypothetical protein VFL76_03390 [Edaphocola sp.]|nr:hypothetical protein [Edaphocola sp.]
MQIKRSNIIYLILGIIGLFIVVKLIVQISSAINQQKPASQAAIEEYRHLFHGEEMSELSNAWNYNSSVRNQFSLFDYGKDQKYCLLIYKIPVQNDFSLANINTHMNNDLALHSGGYLTINENYTEFSYKIGKPPKAKSISLSYVGNSFKTMLSSDSIISYYYFGNKIAIKLNDENTFDLYGGAKNEQESIPFEIVFTKKDRKIYLIIMTVNNLGDSIPPGKLNSILLE